MTYKEKCLALRLGAFLVITLGGCATPQEPSLADMQSWTLSDATFFPADRSLTHAEDGVVLADGTLLVGDFEHGLVRLSTDGAKRPFGDFDSAGYKAKPAPDWNSPNGISFEPDMRHVLVADITQGHIYRVDTVTESVTHIYDHPFGVNSAVRDSSGAVWFTQSTENPAGDKSEERMFAAADRPLSDGALYRIAAGQIGKPNPVAELMVDGLDFANGLAIDERRGELYVNELVANRILGFRVDVRTGELSDRRVIADVTTPDNIEIDDAGQLWVVSPIGNEVVVIDPDTGRQRSVFGPTPDASARLAHEWRRRLSTGESTLSLLGPDTWGPMPGLLTGIILSSGDRPIYVSGLGDALVKLQ